jgi:hypothetical protein
MKIACPDPQMRLASSPPPIRDRKTESANSCYGERFFSKLLERNSGGQLKCATSGHNGDRTTIRG